MSHSVSYGRDGDVGIVTVNNPPVNVLGTVFANRIS